MFASRTPKWEDPKIRRIYKKITSILVAGDYVNERGMLVKYEKDFKISRRNPDYYNAVKELLIGENLSMTELTLMGKYISFIEAKRKRQFRNGIVILLILFMVSSYLVYRFLAIPDQTYAFVSIPGSLMEFAVGSGICALLSLVYWAVYMEDHYYDKIRNTMQVVCKVLKEELVSKMKA